MKSSGAAFTGGRISLTLSPLQQVYKQVFQKLHIFIFAAAIVIPKKDGSAEL